MATSDSTDTQPKSEQVAIESLTLAQVFRLFRPVHMWAVLVLVCGLLSGSFTLGYKLKSNIAEAELVKEKTAAESKISALQTSSNRFQLLEAKEHYLTFLSRYLISKDAASRSPSDKALNDQKSEDLKKLAMFIDEQLNRQTRSTDREGDKNAFYIGRGETQDKSRIIFGYDNTSWPVPSEALKHMVRLQVDFYPHILSR